MFCKEDDGSDSVYIGEAENVKDRLVLARKYMVLRMRFGRDCIVYGILVVQSLLLFAFEESVLYYVCGTALFVAIAALYRDELRPIAQKGVQLLRRNK